MSGKPNIVWIISDDTNFGMLGYTGGKVLTPNIDSIARNGVALSRFHTAAPACGPSRYCYLTGRYPGRCPLSDFQGDEQYKLGFNALIHPDKERTIANAMSDAGYTTGFVGKWHVGATEQDTADMIEFEPDEDPRDPRVSERMEKQQEQLCNIVKKAGFDYAHSVIWGNHESLPRKAMDHNIEWITKGALDFIGRSAGGDRPFFLSMAPTTIHAPDHASSMLVDPRLTGGGWSEDHISCQASRQSVYDRLHRAGIEYNSTTVGALWMDDGVGAVMSKLEELGILEDTVVIFSTDHGPSVGGKFSTYQRGVHIPFTAQWPGHFPAGKTCDALAENVDLLPTLLDIAGAELPPDLVTDGRSILPLMTGAKDELDERDDIYFEFGYSRSIRTARWKYIAFRPPASVIDELKNNEVLRTHYSRLVEPGVVPNTLIMGTMLCYPHFFEPDQLYDLENDPYETKNLVGSSDHAEVVDNMRQRLKSRLDSIGAPFPLDSPDPFMLSDRYGERCARLIEYIHDNKDVWIRNKLTEGYYHTEAGVPELLGAE